MSPRGARGVEREPTRARIFEPDLPARVHRAPRRVVRALPRAADEAQVDELRAGARSARRRRRELHRLPRTRGPHRRPAQVAARLTASRTDVRADFGGPQLLCAGCHQFNFPAARQHDARTCGRASRATRRHPMQNTVAEHAAGAHASEGGVSELSWVTCTARSIPGGHDEGMLEDARCRLDGVPSRVADVVARVDQPWEPAIGCPPATCTVISRCACGGPSAPERLKEHFLVRTLRSADPMRRQDRSTSDYRPRARTAPARIAQPLKASSGATRASRSSVELRFVYTIDEFPLHALGEPAFTTVAKPNATPACRSSLAAELPAPRR